MKILAADTASKTCSVAIVDNDTLICELTINHQSTHAKFLMGAVNKVLQTAGLSLFDVDGLAVTTGPGSFTGLRIGVSAFKGFSVACGKPVVGISSLDALAYPFSDSSIPVCAMLDARKGEVYAARYRPGGNGPVTERSARALDPVDALEGMCNPYLFVGDGAVTYRELIVKNIGPKAVFAHPEQHYIRAAVVANLAKQRFKKNDIDDAADLVPYYIRKSDAENKLRPQLK